jgi:hypothetical protein
MLRPWKKILRKLLKLCTIKISFKFVLYLILTIVLVLALLGFGLLLRIAVGIYLIHRLFILASHGWTCPTCLAKMLIAGFIAIIAFIGTFTEALVFFIVLMWADFIFFRSG